MAAARRNSTATRRKRRAGAARSGTAGLDAPPSVPPFALAIVPSIVPSITPAAPEPATSRDLERILELLRARTGNDFRLYKPGTLQRRVARRLSVHALPDLDAYADYLAGNADEADALVRELLIGLTSFFREERAFAVLRDVVLPARLADASAPRTLRAWVAGCSSGEEAYSLAMLLDEELARSGAHHLDFVVHATDLDTHAIAVARAGWYGEELEAHVSEERRERYLRRADGGYYIADDLRARVVFGQHDLAGDAPITRLDVVCCRNVLIYMQPALQERLLRTFHHALVRGGALVLGAAESVSSAGELFAPIEPHAPVFRRLDVEDRDRRRSMPASPAPRDGLADKGGAAEVGVVDALHRRIVDTVAPASVLVNRRGDILYSSRRTGRYLDPAVGKSNLNVFAMARPGLRSALALAVREAAGSASKVRHAGVVVPGERRSCTIDLLVHPLQEPPLRGLLLIVFEERAATGAAALPPARAGLSVLEGELLRTQARLEEVLRDVDASHVDLRTVSEELQTSNEALQSRSEELSTTREELSRLHEEMIVATRELEHRVRDLASANVDLRALLDGIGVATIVVDAERRVVRSTRDALRVSGVTAEDVGRPITELRLRVDAPDLAGDIEDVLQTLVARQRTVTSDHGSLYELRIQPYCSGASALTGVMITFADVTAMRRAEEALTGRVHESVLARFLGGWPGMAYVDDVAQDRDVYLNGPARAWLDAAGAADARFGSVFHPDDVAAEPGWRRRLDGLGAGELATRRMRLRGPDGYRSFEATSSVLSRDPRGGVAQVMVVFGDARA